MLTVISRTANKTANGQWRWLCVCDCGQQTSVNTGNLQCGRTKSCGCLNKRRGASSPNFKHGIAIAKGTAEHKRYQRECYDRHKYKLEPAHKQALLEKQNGGCAICEYKFGQKIGDMHVDHDHKTGAVRGLLCDLCNRGLGYFKDQASRLIAASKYLAR